MEGVAEEHMPRAPCKVLAHTYKVLQVYSAVFLANIHQGRFLPWWRNSELRLTGHPSHQSATRKTRWSNYEIIFLQMNHLNVYRKGK